MAKLYKTNGQVLKIKPKNGTDFKLEELYELLDCESIEVVYIPSTRKITIIDEEGKYSSKNVNHAVTGYLRYHSAIRDDDCIVGDAIICDRNELK